MAAKSEADRLHDDALSEADAMAKAYGEAA
jgi:hypothetical protein